MKLSKEMRDIFGAAKVASVVKKSLEVLVENVVCSDHTMKACIEIFKIKDNEKEVDPLCQALLLDLVNQMKLRMDKAIDHLDNVGRSDTP